jgi:hypothetical protein
MAAINFFTPIMARRQTSSYSDVNVVAHSAGSVRKTTGYNVYMAGFFKKISAKWKYVKFGIDSNNNIIIKQGEKGDYLISQHSSQVTNKDLVTKLIEISGNRMPIKSGEYVRVDFMAMPTNGHFTLLKKSESVC